MEIWKEFTKGYEVSNLGNVRSYFTTHGVIIDEPHPLKQSLSYKGRPIIRIRDGIKKTYYIHRLVLEAFIGKCPIGMQACHFDDNKLNNKVENLRWDTHLANVADGARNGTVAKGERSAQSRLTNEEVLDIRRRYAKGERSSSLASKFGVTPTSIRAITSGRSWKHLGGLISVRNDR